MTMPNQTAPDGAYVIGGGTFKYGQNLNETVAYSQMTGGTGVKISNARQAQKENVDDRFGIVEGAADQAVSDSSAAVNAALAAESTAASASERASYWEAEFVVASAAVVLGVNELLIGLCQNVPSGMTRRITDMHVALLTQPNGMSFELKKWDADGLVDSVLGTYSIPANGTRANWPGLNFEMQNRERVFVNVTSVTGTVAPLAFQILLFGVME